MTHTMLGVALSRGIWAATRAAPILMAWALASGCSSADSETLIPETAEELGWLRDASEAWAQAGVAPPPVSQYGSANVHVVDEIDEICGPTAGASTLACTRFDPLAIYFSRSIPEPLLARTVLHEMGHALRGDGLHLATATGCPSRGRGPFIMCPATGVEAPTDSDVAFIEAGAH